MVHCQKTPEEPRECVTGISEEVAQWDVAEGLRVLPERGRRGSCRGLAPSMHRGVRRGEAPLRFFYPPRVGDQGG